MFPCVSLFLEKTKYILTPNNYGIEAIGQVQKQLPLGLFIIVFSDRVFLLGQINASECLPVVTDTTGKIKKCQQFLLTHAGLNGAEEISFTYVDVLINGLTLELSAV